jgi:MarR family transcriptional regulator, organic hydroperoxide resistance regulator
MKKGTKSRGVEVPPVLPAFLCFAVYSANLAFHRAYKPLFEGLGLTYPQYVALVALNEENDQTVSQLGQKLFLESSTLTPLLKRLEATGHVTRRRDSKDERQVRVSLTAKGRSVFEQVFCGCGEIVTATGLNAESYARLQRELIELRDRLLAASKP